MLLVLMPLLSTWSIASAYCGEEESGGRSQHLSHHVDKHHGDETAGSTDADCDHCHSPGATLLSFSCSAQCVVPDRQPQWTDVALSAPPVALPERPKWVHLA
ncbi:MAG: hypothetical protein EOO22_18900 [Comamonadaceae bacterium]|nr:MAG: hypothetical protein EOO22_18900 [Comamonadaceae bacterium]